MKILRFVATGGVAMVFLSSISTARAQERSGFALDRFEPAERGSQFFVIDNLDLRGGERPALGATVDYAYKPLVVYDRDGNERAAIVRHQLFTHVGGSLVLGHRLRFGANLPIAAYQDGESIVVNGEAYRASTKPAIGDLRLAADLRLVGEKSDPLTVALGIRGWLPTGAASQFTSDGSARIAPQILAAGDLGIFTYAARLAIVYRARDDAYAGSSLGSELTGGIGGGIKTIDGRLVVGPEVFASSVFTSGDAFFKTRGTPAEWLFGAHYDVTPDVRLGAGIGSGLTRGYGAPVMRGLFSLEWAPAYAEPTAPTPALPAPPAADADGDGIPDKEDACAAIPGIRTSDPLTNGCPDRDADTIPDHQDACPDVKGERTNNPRTNGCPPDRDDDGVFDFEDACPELKGTRTHDPKTNGCPADTDADGILDNEDACPKLAGPRNQDPKKNGCPLVIVTDKEIKITEQVKFKFNSAELETVSDEILGAVKGVLEAHAEIKKVRVEGHTDNVGKPAYNKDLSRRRAASVVKWLAAHGVNDKRLVAAGFGQEEPVDSNDTDTGRANNRRVAFTILERDETAKPPAPGP